MGNCLHQKRSDYVVYVVTGDKHGAGTDANLKIVLHDDSGTKSSEFKLDRWFHNDFERGSTDDFKINLPQSLQMNKIDKIEFWRDESGAADDWYLERILVEDMKTNEMTVFPVYRWIQPYYHYIIKDLDTSLPQLDQQHEQRCMELTEKRKHYVLAQKAPGMPAQVDSLPADEKFSWDYKWDIMKMKAKLLIESKVVQVVSGEWDSIMSLRQLYTKKHLEEPPSARQWTNDLYFGLQRVASCSHDLLRLCTKVPEKLGLTEKMMRPILEGLTLQQAVEKNRLFYTDLEILQDLPLKNKSFTLCVPIALYFENGEGQLVPVAIQLFQQKSKTNPVFLPTDPPNTWLMAKIWYNNADASYHQAVTHLCYTHLLMEGVCVSFHRQLSQSHPVFKLLAPHFLYLIAINSRGLDLLISPGGWVDKTMSMGVVGMFELIIRGCNRWRMDMSGTLPENLRERGLLDDLILKYFPFRDDAMLFYKAIQKYVTNYVNLYYDTPDKIIEDSELQSWRAELTRSKDDCGVGLEGVPGEEGQFTTVAHVITTLTCIIYTCTVGHASTNFPQYNEYAFPPNFPGLLRGQPPKNKNALTMDDILNTIPDKPTTLDTMVVTKILSGRGTKNLGNFEVNYIFDPPARELVNEFKADIKKVGEKIKERNKTRNPEYTYLNPDDVPNSISI